MLVRIFTSLTYLREFCPHPPISTHPFSPHFVCVHLTITPCQTKDRSCNRMSAFLDSMALFSVPTRQIAKKVKLSFTITEYKNDFPPQTDAFFGLTWINFHSLPYIITYVSVIANPSILTQAMYLFHLYHFYQNIDYYTKSSWQLYSNFFNITHSNHLNQILYLF